MNQHRGGKTCQVSLILKPIDYGLKLAVSYDLIIIISSSRFREKYVGCISHRIQITDKKFCQDDVFYPIACSSSSSSFFVDDKLLHNELERTSVTSTTATSQFLCIDHHSHCHSFVNDLYLIDTNNFCYYPSSSFIDPLLSIEDLRAHLASVYILITGSSLTEINNEDESSFQHETSIKEVLIDLNEQHCSAIL
ncbi:unnamed protein product [Rotaria sp. Silwood2]|nr:unnamed protein product [Rotaria sp. Silwood2]CAF4495179.1 unnamed protein product [Rotaria sp. Silwood2]